MVNLILSALLVCFGAQAFANPIGDVEGTVVGVVDGDTLDVSTGTVVYRVRLAAIDAPERSQAFGQRAKQELAAMVHGRRVSLRCSKQERRPEGQRSREICTVFSGGRDINLSLVSLGWAWHYKAYAREQSSADRNAYEAAEASARASARGLWEDRNVVAPWAYRRDLSKGVRE